MLNPFPPVSRPLVADSQAKNKIQANLACTGSIGESSTTVNEAVKPKPDDSITFYARFFPPI